MAEAEEKEDFKVLFRRRAPQYLAAAAVANSPYCTVCGTQSNKPCTGGFCLGCGLGWSAPCVELLKDDYKYDPFSVNVIASVFPFGAALGMPVVPLLIDKIGRKWLMLVLVPPFMVGWICIIAGVSLLPLIAFGRLLTGACGGMFCVAAPMYSAEISEKQIRGTLGVFFQLLIVIGIMYAFCCGYTNSIVSTSILCGIAPIIFGCIMIFMPESPLYYIQIGKEEAAKNSMNFLRGPNFNIEPEMKEFREQAEKSKRQSVKLSMFLRRPVLKTLVIAYGLMFAQQFSGINAIIFYCSTIFKQTGVDMDHLLQMVVVAVVQVIACIISALLIDKLGRKLLMLISMGVMGLCLTTLGFFFILKTDDSQGTDSLFWLPLLSCSLYIVAFCLGAGPIPWVYMGEIFPAKLKGTASSSAAFLNWMMAFTVTISFSSVVGAIGNACTFFFFAIVCAVSVGYLLIFMVETKGKTFAEILTEFGTYDLEDE